MFAKLAKTPLVVTFSNLFATYRYVAAITADVLANDVGG